MGILGYKHSPETRAKIKLALLKDIPGYGAVHKRMRASKTGRCGHCEKRGWYTDMALIHGRETHIDTKGQRYSVRPEDYQELCLSCHKIYDLSGELLGGTLASTGVALMPRLAGPPGY